MVYGVTGPGLGLFNVTLDGTLMGAWSAANDVVAHGVVLYFASNVDTTAIHQVVLTATSGGSAVGLILDSFVAYGDQGAVGFM